MALVGRDVEADVEVLAAPELVERLVGDDGPAVDRGRARGHDGRAVRRLVGEDFVGHGAHDPGGVEGPPVAGDLVIAVPADEVVDRGGHAGRREAVRHALELVHEALGDPVLVQAYGLLAEPLVAHAVGLQRHVVVHPEGVGVLVRQQVTLLEPALVGSARHLHVVPSRHVGARRLVHHRLLLVCEGTHGTSSSQSSYEWGSSQKPAQKRARCPRNIEGRRPYFWYGLSIHID